MTLMEVCRRAAEKVASWSPAKRELARHITERGRFEQMRKLSDDFGAGPILRYGNDRYGDNSSRTPEK